jgi:hypothetical protein
MVQFLGGRSLLTLSKEAVSTGIIKTENKTDAEIMKEIFQHARNTFKEGLLVVTDFRQDLLRDAAFFMKKKKYENACLFYATWTEHWVNKIIIKGLEINAIPFAYVKQIIKETNIRSKLSWLFYLLEFKQLPSNHVSKILKLMELRNEYVHYKWSGKPDKIDMDQENALSIFLNEYCKTIKYLSAYENKNINRNKSKKLRQILKPIGT